jgi:hypothetical protein
MARQYRTVLEVSLDNSSFAHVNVAICLCNQSTSLAAGDIDERGQDKSLDRTSPARRYRRCITTLGSEGQHDVRIKCWHTCWYTAA